MLSPIRKRYLLCLNVDSYCDAEGRRYLHELWHKDLAEHVRYLTNLTVASPCQISVPPVHSIPWDSPHNEVRFVDLPASSNTLSAILRLPQIAVRLWREIGRAEIVHVGIAGWPIPFG